MDIHEINLDFADEIGLLSNRQEDARAKLCHVSEEAEKIGFKSICRNHVSKYPKTKGNTAKKKKTSKKWTFSST